MHPRCNGEDEFREDAVRKGSYGYTTRVVWAPVMIRLLAGIARCLLIYADRRLRNSLAGCFPSTL